MYVCASLHFAFSLYYYCATNNTVQQNKYVPQLELFDVHCCKSPDMARDCFPEVQ